MLVDIKLLMYVIYDHPDDYPDNWVTVVNSVHKDGAIRETVKIYGSLEQARSEIPEGKTNIGRHMRDDLVIKEVWI